MKRNYPLLLVSQFLGAFGDNAVLAVIVGQLTFLRQDGLITESQLGRSNAIYTSLLFVPYVLLAPLAGFLNDRFAKTRGLMGGNLVKLAGTLICALSVWNGAYWQGIGYFIVGIGSCIYSPAKYGILPEILPKERLVKANGTVELLTLVAILSGAIAGAVMIDKLPPLICFGLVASIFAGSFILNAIMTTTPHDPGVHLNTTLVEFTKNFGDLLKSSRLSRVLLGTGIFWVLGAVMKMNFQPWGLRVLHFENNTQISLLFIWLSLGVMIGSVLAGQLHKVGDLGRTRLYGWLMAGFVVLLGAVELLPVLMANPLTLPVIGIVYIPVVLLLILAGGAAGLFLIPLNAALQSESHPSKLGKTIATQNFVDNLGMIFGGVFVVSSIGLGLNASGVFFALGAVLILLVLPLKFKRNP